ncbi:MAG: hypothetical protein AM1032_000160 [Mycoplasmataceae bacterium]|nr:MAG: hypothetical protein AM1032_000160 [Mycoplasmataceae bacterium]
MTIYEKKLIIKCFICKKDIFEDEQAINKSLNKSWARNLLTSSWNDTTNYENMIICENCTLKEIEDEVKSDQYNYQTGLMIFGFLFCYLFWFEVFKELSQELKWKTSCWISIFTILIYIYIVYGKDDKEV